MAALLASDIIWWRLPLSPTSHISGFHSRLVQPLGDAMGIRAVIACLSRHIEHRDGLQVNDLAQRRSTGPRARQECGRRP